MRGTNASGRLDLLNVTKRLLTQSVNPAIPALHPAKGLAHLLGCSRRRKILHKNAALFRPYVFRCVRNAALDGRRRTQVRTDSIFASHAPEEIASLSPADGCLAGELDERLQCLSSDERETIVLKIYDALTFQEIADLREVPLPTVASWYRRGLEKLRAMLIREIR